MHALATYFHGAPALADAGLYAPAILAVPGVVWGVAWARRRKASRG